MINLDSAIKINEDEVFIEKVCLIKDDTLILNEIAYNDSLTFSLKDYSNRYIMFYTGFEAESKASGNYHFFIFLVLDDEKYIIKNSILSSDSSTSIAGFESENYRTFEFNHIDESFKIAKKLGIDFILSRNTYTLTSFRILNKNKVNFLETIYDYNNSKLFSVFETDSDIKIQDIDSVNDKKFEFRNSVKLLNFYRKYISNGYFYAFIFWINGILAYLITKFSDFSKYLDPSYKGKIFGTLLLSFFLFEFLFKEFYKAKCTIELDDNFLLYKELKYTKKIYYDDIEYISFPNRKKIFFEMHQGPQIMPKAYYACIIKCKNELIQFYYNSEEVKFDVKRFLDNNLID